MKNVCSNKCTPTLRALAILLLSVYSFPSFAESLCVVEPLMRNTKQPGENTKHSFSVTHPSSGESCLLSLTERDGQLVLGTSDPEGPKVYPARACKAEHKYKSEWAFSFSLAGDCSAKVNAKVRSAIVKVAYSPMGECSAEENLSGCCYPVPQDENGCRCHPLYMDGKIKSCR